MAKRIGILGGISAESTVEYYRRIIHACYERGGDAPYPEIVIFSLDFERFTKLENRGDEASYIAEILAGIRALEGAGAECILMAANSPHAVFDQVATKAQVPMLSIVDAVVKESRARGLRRLLLLGIKFTMHSSFYPDAFARLGMEVITPTEAEQDEIERIIFDELTRGICCEASRARLLAIIERHPVDGAILGCTELPLLLRQKDTQTILLDTLELHVQAALDYALGTGTLRH